jgi:hypothetical protein
MTKKERETTDEHRSVLIRGFVHTFGCGLATVSQILALSAKFLGEALRSSRLRG